MARFRGSVQGERGEATRLGNKKLAVTADGWDDGVAVILRHDDETDTDYVEVWITGGSNSSHPAWLLYEGPLEEASPEIETWERPKYDPDFKTGTEIETWGPAIHHTQV